MSRTVTQLSVPPTDEEGLRRQLVRLACDVHDGPLQSLTAAGYGVRDLQRRLAEAGELGAEAILAELDTIVARLAGTESGLRTLIGLLEQRHLDGATVGELLEPEIEAFERQCPIHVSVRAPMALQPDSHSQGLAIRSVVREALTNIAKHARADHVQIRMEAGPAGILLEIEDDGSGFDFDGVRGDALGLAGMRQRIELLGGELDILTRPGGPTVVTARLERWYGE